MSRCEPPSKTKRFAASVGVIVGEAGLSCGLRQAARRLDVHLRPLRGPHPHDNRVLIEFAGGCDVVTIEGTGPPTSGLEVFASSGIALRPNLRAVELSRDPVMTRRVLGESGFDVSAAGPEGVSASAAASGASATFRSADSLDVVITRSPSGYWLAYPAKASKSLAIRMPFDLHRRAVEIAASIANGIDAVGIVGVNFDVVSGTPRINTVDLGPGFGNRGTTAVSVYESHLRALLDWPFRTTNSLQPVRGRCRSATGHRN